jgi:glycosyltransferase involved in cell wall biosynthesis
MGLNGIFTGFSLIRLCKKLVKERGIEIVLGYNMIPEAIAAFILARKLKLPVGFWAIGSDVNDIMPGNLLNYHLSKMCIKKSDLIITESKDLEQKIQQLCQQPQNIHTFYKGIDVANFQNLPAKNILLEKLGLDRAKKYLLFVGRIIREKGITELAQSFIKIAKRYPDLDLLMIGEENEKKKLRDIFQSASISHRVHFKGIISHKEVAYYMKAADVLVHPSWSEGLPNVIMEAMACSLPVVASDVGGIPEVLINGVTGLSVPAKDSEKLTAAISEMLDNEQLRGSCVHRAHELIAEKFDVRGNALILYKLISLTLKNSSH